MKFTPTIEMRLNALKDRLLLKVTGEYWFNKTLDLFYVVGWTVEDVPAKKGWLGHDAYKKLVDIEVIATKYIGTKFVGVVRPNEEYIAYLEKARDYWLKVKDDLTKFNYSIEFIKNEQEYKNP